MSDEMPDQESKTNEIDETGQCLPGCNCKKTGLGMKGKVIVCLVVLAIAATAVLANSFLRKTEKKTAQAAQSVTMQGQAKSSAWGEPLKSLEDLNEVAATQDAVFVYLADKDAGPQEAVKQQIEKAKKGTEAGGLKTALFILATDSKDYAQVTRQASAPCVLAMVKGRGMKVVGSNITEGALLNAIAAASNPSGGCCSAK